MLVFRGLLILQFRAKILRPENPAQILTMAFQPPTSLIDVPRASYGDKPAVIIPATETSDAHTVSYASLARLVEQVARQLRVLLPVETKPDGMVVALTIPNSLEFPLAFLGIAWAGAATAPLNPDYKQDEFAFYLEVRICCLGNKDIREIGVFLSGKAL